MRKEGFEEPFAQILFPAGAQASCSSQTHFLFHFGAKRSLGAPHLQIEGWGGGGGGTGICVCSIRCPVWYHRVIVWGRGGVALSPIPWHNVTEIALGLLTNCASGGNSGLRLQSSKSKVTQFCAAPPPPPFSILANRRTNRLKLTALSSSWVQVPSEKVKIFKLSVRWFGANPLQESQNLTPD